MVRIDYSSFHGLTLFDDRIAAEGNFLDANLIVRAFPHYRLVFIEKRKMVHTRVITLVSKFRSQPRDSFAKRRVKAKFSYLTQVRVSIAVSMYNVKRLEFFFGKSTHGKDIEYPVDTGAEINFFVIEFKLCSFMSFFLFAVSIRNSVHVKTILNFIRT